MLRAFPSRCTARLKIKYVKNINEKRKIFCPAAGNAIKTSFEVAAKKQNVTKIQAKEITKVKKA